MSDTQELPPLPEPATPKPTLAGQLVQQVSTERRITGIESATSTIKVTLIVIAAILFAVASELGYLIGRLH